MTEKRPGYSYPETLDERQVDELHALYRDAWWSRDRTRDDVCAVLRGSHPIVAICDEASGRLVAFARVLTDGLIKALVFDVIVAKGRRDEGLGRHLMDCIVAHPALRSVKHIELYCLPEMIPFYEKWGFSAELGGAVLMRRTRAER